MATPCDVEGSVRSAGSCRYKYKRFAGASSGGAKCAATSQFAASAFLLSCASLESWLKVLIALEKANVGYAGPVPGREASNLVQN
jgi:hypothetical protein